MPLDSWFKADIPDDLDTTRSLQNSKAGSILFVHSRRDPVVPYDAARRMYESYGGPKQFLETNPPEGANAHFGSVSDLNARTQILDFLKQHLTPGQT